MKILIHLISGQSLPTYIASKIVMPDKNIFLYTESLKNTLPYYHNCINAAYTEIKIDAYNFNNVYQQVCSIFEMYPDDEVVLNFTGGTKLMSIAAFQAAQKFGKKAIYIDSDNDRYVSFIGTENYAVKIDVRISPNAYLNLQGQKVKEPSLKFSEDLEKLMIRTADFIIKNTYKVYPFIMKFAEKYPKIGKALDYSASSGSVFSGSYIKLNNGISEVAFYHKNKNLFSAQCSDQYYLEFLRGKWFEIACYLKIKELKIFDTVEPNLEVNWKKHYEYIQFGKNEIDVFAMKGVIPFAFECKSGRIEKEAVNKLKAIKETFLGRFSNIFFISLNKPSQDLMERFEESAITYINYWDLDKLRTIVSINKKIHV